MLKRAFFVSILLVGVAADARAVTIDTVPVGNAGNAGDVLVGHGTHGAVAYSYRIGTTEVTNAQYAAFLNAKAASDPLGLYNASMDSDVLLGRDGGITRNGVDGNYAYAPKTNMGDKPVNWVSWYDAIRFANWLHNGQGTGDTETGAYTILGGMPAPSNATAIQRNAGAVWFVPSDNEWYKAAYYDPTLASGNGGYWDYSTRSNTAPTSATANSVGDVSNSGANLVNYNYGADWNGRNGNVTTVGSAGPLSESYYGTSDQGGNVAEWTELGLRGEPPYRNQHGGAWSSNSDFVRASAGGFILAEAEDFSLGFRVALVPEPSSFVLAAFGIVALAAWGWRHCD